VSGINSSTALWYTSRATGVVSLLLLALAFVLGYDNWRTGIGWDSTGPQAGYFPFYLSVILGAASLYGLVTVLLTRKEAAETFVTRAQLRRVMAVFAAAKNVLALQKANWPKMEP